MDLTTPEGLALYLRRYARRRHGTPRQLMKHHANHGAKWVAIGGLWQEGEDGSEDRFINSPDRCRQLLDAAHDEGLEGYVWTYPWLGREEECADALVTCLGDHKRVLLDPELGSNPNRARRGPRKKRANKHAETLVEKIHERIPDGVCGLSTFGSGVRLSWFPLYAFARTLARLYPGRTFLGGQTYTDDARVDPSIADFLRAINRFGGLDKIKLVPNFGTYSWRDVPEGAKRRARSKRPAEQAVHFMEFIDEGEPVEALIGWAENFMTSQLWREFAKMAARMEREACGAKK